MSLSDQFAEVSSERRSFRKSNPLFDGSLSRIGRRPILNLHLLGWTGRLALALIMVDLFAIAMGFGLAVVVADTLRALLEVDQIAAWPFLTARAHELCLMAGLAVGIFAFGGLYRRSGWELDEIRKVVAGICLVAMFDATLQFVLNDHNSRIWAVVAYPLVALSVISCRMAMRSLPSMRDAMTSHIVMLGRGTTPETLIHELRESRAGEVNLLHSLSLEDVHTRDPHQLIQMLERLAWSRGVPVHRVQIVLTPQPDELDAAQTVLNLLNATQLPYSVILPFAGLARSGLCLRSVVGADMVMAEMQPSGPALLTSLFKRLFDLFTGTLMLVLLAPVLVALILLLWLEKGPVFFSQPRVGRGGRVFNCLKFRSMRVDAQERLKVLLDNDPEARLEWAKYQKLQDDPRVTTLGKFLRKTSLDELPQLFNVLLGDMSLVGPRPIIAPEIDGYPGDRAYYANPDFTYYKRCTPGITGLWQVSGRNETSHDERVRLDRWYARNWSLWLDLMILLKTIRVVLLRGGSA